MNSKYDVIVVGAGPAGLLAARAVAENGFSVALIDKKAEIPVMDRCCAQTLHPANEYLHNDIFKIDHTRGRLCFPAHGFSIRYDGPYRNVYGTYAYSPNGHKMQVGVCEELIKKGDYGAIASVIDKEVLLHCLVDEAKNYGADIFSGINVTQVEGTSSGVIVRGSGRTFCGRYLIAADGVNSKIAEMMGFNANRVSYGSLRSMLFYISNVQVPNKDVSYTVFGFPKDGPVQFFLFPRPIRSEYIAAMITVHPGVDLNAAWEYFNRETPTSIWLKNGKILKRYSAVCNNRTPITEPYKDHILVIGDAAATQEIEITGAIIWGWQAGNAISQALQEENLELPITALSSYLKKWNEEHLQSHSHETLMKNYALPYVLNEPEDIDYVFSLIKEPLPAGMNPYVSRSGESIRKVIPQITQERPALLQKLQKMGLPAKEILSEVIE